MDRFCRTACVAAALLGAAGCAGAAPPAAIPAEFHGTWVEDRQHCRDLPQVRMVIHASGYSREETDAAVRDVRLLRDAPPHVRISFDSRAEGQAWSTSEEWLMARSADAFMLRSDPVGEISGEETLFVRC